MRLVVDTNVLITAFWKESAFNQIAQLPHLTLYAPSYALDEINRYREEITKKTGTTGAHFDGEKSRLFKRVRFFKLEEYRSSLKAVALGLKDLNEPQREALLEDIDFLALAHARRCALWSNDTLTKHQNRVDVLTTRELMLLLEP
jgi:predicted nucleic acid-binding protein